MKDKALEHLIKLAEALEELLDVDHCGELLDFESLLCSGCHNTILDRNNFDVLVEELIKSQDYISHQTQPLKRKRGHMSRRIQLLKRE